MITFNILCGPFQPALPISGAIIVTRTALPPALPVAMESVAPVSQADGGLCVTRCVETTVHSVTTIRDVCNASLVTMEICVCIHAPITALMVVKKTVAIVPLAHLDIMEINVDKAAQLIVMEGVIKPMDIVTNAK